MSNFINIINDFTNLNNIYEQELMNNIIEMSMNQEEKCKHILSKKGEKELTHVEFHSDSFSMKECPITLKEFNE